MPPASHAGAWAQLPARRGRQPTAQVPRCWAVDQDQDETRRGVTLLADAAGVGDPERARAARFEHLVDVGGFSRSGPHDMGLFWGDWG